MSENYGVDVLGTEGQLAVRASANVTDNLWHLPRPMEVRCLDDSPSAVTVLARRRSSQIGSRWIYQMSVLKSQSSPCTDG